MGKKDGRWAIEVNEVGPKVVQPLKPTVHNVITSNPLNTAKPKSVCLEAAHSQCLKSGLATTVISHITTKPSNSGSKSQDAMDFSSVVSVSLGANKPVSADTHPDGAHSVHSDSRYATITKLVPLSLVSPSVSASPGTDKSISYGSFLVPSDTSSDSEFAVLQSKYSVLACY